MKTAMRRLGIAFAAVVLGSVLSGCIVAPPPPHPGPLRPLPPPRPPVVIIP